METPRRPSSIYPAMNNALYANSLNLLTQNWIIFTHVGSVYISFSKESTPYTSMPTVFPNIFIAETRISTQLAINIIKNWQNCYFNVYNCFLIATIDSSLGFIKRELKPSSSPVISLEPGFIILEGARFLTFFKISAAPLPPHGSSPSAFDYYIGPEGPFKRYTGRK